MGPVASAPNRLGQPLQNDDSNRIWNTSSAEERERIKDFWQSLGEDERKSLVKIEREAVLRKMKEQQKVVCGCSICGRKRTAIEEELEVLYDAYYDELEQYAPDNQKDGFPKPIFPYPKSMSQHPYRLRPVMPMHARPSRGQIRELADESDANHSDPYSDEDYEEADDGSDESAEISAEMSADMERTPSDFFHFGNSLTVKGTD
jgi:Salt tolerance down-regulator